MAERRMFAKTIIDSDAFLEMPQSTQLLYFHLSMRADDDGFINNPKSIMRNVGCKEDDIRILSGKKFIIPFESGIVVIKHWKIHNYIQKDRYHETKYKEEKATLNTDENGAYTRCIQDVSKMDTQVRLGKDSIDKVSNKEAHDKPAKPQKHKHGEYAHVLLTSDEYLRLSEEWGEQELTRMIKTLDEGIETKGYKYKNHCLALRKWRENEKTTTIYSKQPQVSEKKICPSCGSTLTGLFCKTCLTQYNEKMEATF